MASNPTSSEYTCQSCLRDQRVVGDQCCSESIRKLETLERAKRYLARFGITLEGLHDGYGDRLHPEDAAELLKYLEEKKLLVSMKGVPKKLR